MVRKQPGMNVVRSHASRLVLVAAAGTMLAGCASTGVNNTSGRKTVYEDVRSSSTVVQGVGIESQDIVGVTDKMMRDMLATPVLAGRNPPPRIIIDSEYFTNESSSRINKNSITDRLRIELQRAAQGRMVFVGRQYAAMVENERELKRAGVTDGGTIRKTQGTAGADFRLVGRITSLDAVDTATSTTSRYQQITFEMIDLEYGTVVWGGIYEFKKTAQDDVIYR
ncbi:curli biogenesis system outer membrane secretion channel CsgG [Metapseudomonas resinovorans]